MATRRIPAVVSASWLKQNIASNHHVRILDASWQAARRPENHASYVRDHIPGAIHFDLDRCIKPTPLLPRNLPEATCFQDYARSLGVSNDNHIVIYDREKIHASCRAWWSFKVYGHENVSVLDGGLVNWKLNGYPLESGQNTPTQQGDFEVHLKRHLLVLFEDVVDLVNTRARQIVDARRSQHYQGTGKEPSKYSINVLRDMDQAVPETMHRGHIPGSLHLHKNDLIDPKTKCFLEKEKLHKLFSAHGVDVYKPMTTLCYGGHSATLLNMAAMILNPEADTNMYFGSWTEWGQRAPLQLIQMDIEEKPDS